MAPDLKLFVAWPRSGSLVQRRSTQTAGGLKGVELLELVQ
jgi:hypothetical protein